MNILLVNNFFNNGEYYSLGGVEYHRMSKPNQVLRRLNPEFDLCMTNGISDEIDHILSQTDLVIISRSISFDFAEKVYDKLDKMGIPFGIDIDDYWQLPVYHVLTKHYIDNKVPEATVLGLKRAAFVITTTPILAEKIKTYNQNVHVIENGIDTEDESWKVNKAESNRIRFGFTQGNTHFEDIQSISKDVVKALRDEQFYKNAQVIQTGFAGSHIRKTNEQRIQALLTDSFKTIRRDFPDHVHNLRLFRETDLTNVPYQMKWGRDVLEFASVYNEIDVSVVPLLNNTFNSCKSELKMIEAGFKDCAVMVSHVAPYTLLATDKNSYDLNKKPFNEWAKYILNNPNDLADRKAQLKEDTSKYDLNKLTDKRLNLYKQYKR